MISFLDVTVDFGDNKGLFGFTLSVDKGETVGLLGPGGAGKSTAMSLLSGLLAPDTGQVTLDKRMPYRHRADLMAQVGYAPPALPALPGLSAMGYLEMMAGLKKADPAKLKNPETGLGERLSTLAADWDMPLTGLTDRLGVTQRKKLALLSAFLFPVEVYLLDEPDRDLAGEDLGRLISLIMAEKDKGKTVFITSQSLPFLQRVSDRVGLIRQGRLALVESGETLSLTRQKVYHITFSSPAEAVRFATEWEEGVEVTGSRAQVAIPASPGPLIKVLSGYEVLDLIGGRQQMEESFLHFYGDDTL